MAELSDMLAGGPRPPIPPVQATAAEPSENLRPNSTMGIVSFIFGLSGILCVPGLVLGIIALARSKDEGRHYGLAVWGAVLSGFALAAFVAIAIVAASGGDSTALTDPAFTDPAPSMTVDEAENTCDTYGWASIECSDAIAAVE